MLILELVLLLMLTGVALSLVAPLLRLPWLAVLAMAGTGLAFVPGSEEGQVLGQQYERRLTERGGRSRRRG